MKHYRRLTSMFPITYLIIFFRLLSFVTADLMLQRVEKEGVAIEKFFITTEDGYILGLYHLVQPSNISRSNQAPKPILFMHGLLSSSQDFILYRNSSMGYYFYDHGYDVWMLNARGNTFSRNHTTLNPDEKEFWQFSWHEIGHFDLPAAIDFILAKTEQEQLICAGHSQGGSVLTVLLSDRPEYNEKVSSVHLMAPAIILKRYNILLYPAVSNLYEIKAWIEERQFYEIFSYNAVMQNPHRAAVICTNPSMVDICKFLYEIFLGPFAPHSFYNGLFKDVSSVEPNGCGYLQLLHYGQIIRSGRFHKLDHGPSKNLKLYGSRKVPDYNLTNIQTKVHIMYGTNDFLVKQENFPKAIKQFGSVFAVSQLNEFNHVDFIYGRQVHVVPPILLRIINNLE